MFWVDFEDECLVLGASSLFWADFKDDTLISVSSSLNNAEFKDDTPVSALSSSFWADFEDEGKKRIFAVEMKTQVQIEVPGGAQKVLLHACCAPCSSAIVECLMERGITPVIFYSNSNIFPREEYDHRLNECIRYAQKWGIEIVDDAYDHTAWRQCAQGLEAEPERGKRCLECFKQRLLRAAQYAAENGFTVLTTTLASSRWKDLQQVDEAGRWACEQVSGVTWWAQNWRKGGLQERRNQIIKEENFYNQLFCGCEFSRH